MKRQKGSKIKRRRIEARGENKNHQFTRLKDEEKTPNLDRIYFYNKNGIEKRKIKYKRYQINPKILASKIVLCQKDELKEEKKRSRKATKLKEKN